MRRWLFAFALLAPLVSPTVVAEGAPDLAVVLVVPEEVSWRVASNLTLRVENWGSDASGDYGVQVLDGDRELAVLSGSGVPGGGADERRLEWVPERSEHVLRALVDAGSGDADAANDRFEILVSIPDAPSPRVRIESLELVGDEPPVEGVPVTFRVGVHHAGGASVDARVRIAVDGDPVGALDFGTLAPNTTRLADGNWTPPEPGRYALSVRLLEPAGGGVDAERVLQVAVAGRPAPPPAGNTSQPDEPPGGARGSEPVVEPPAPRPERPVLVLGRLEAVPAPGRPGAFLFRVTVENQGDETARDVRVRFLVDDEEASEVAVPVLAPGLGVTVASDAWSGPPGAYEAHVGIVEADGNALVVAAGDRGSAPLEILVPRPAAAARELPWTGGGPMLLAFLVAALGRLHRLPPQQS